MEALGLDPFRASLEELNSTEARLWCTKCQYAPQSGHGEQQILVQVEAFDWMRAVRIPSTACPMLDVTASMYTDHALVLFSL